jgi:hypothetical protein
MGFCFDRGRPSTLKPPRSWPVVGVEAAVDVVGDVADIAGLFAREVAIVEKPLPEPLAPAIHIAASTALPNEPTPDPFRMLRTAVV